VVLAAGIIFELPIVVFFLTKAGLVTPEFLRKYRKHSLVLILALSAIITPPDIFSQILVSLPLIVLYEAGIKISRRIVRKRDQVAKMEEEAEKKEAAKNKKRKAQKKTPETDKKGEENNAEESKPEEDKAEESQSDKKKNIEDPGQENKPSDADYDDEFED
jgi:flagellar biosynthesis GTPase FlhF